MKFTRIALSAIILGAASAALFGVEKVEVICKSGGKTVSRASVAASKTSDGARRFILPKTAIARGIDCVDIYPDAASANKGDAGYFIFPRGEYVNFTRDNFTLARDKSPMPIFGAKTPSETFVAVAKTMLNEYSLRVSAKNGAHKMFMRFEPPKIVGGIYEDIIVDFYTLEGAGANYSGMGRKYRQIRLRDGEIAPIRERIKTNKALARSWDAILVRLVVCGILPTPKTDTPQFGENPPIRAMATFDTQREILDAIKAAGIDKATLVLAGWQRGGFNGCCPDIFPIPPELGGEKKLRELIAYAKRLGYPLTPNADHTCAYRSAKMWDEDYVIKRPDGSLCKMGLFGGGRMHYICLKRSWPLFIRRQMEQAKELGFDGSYYIDVFSARPPDPCCDKRHFATRKEIAKIQNEILASARDIFGAAYSEGGYDHCIANIDGANYTSGSDYHAIYRPKELGKQPLFDGIYPLWEIVYHGIILSTPGRTTQNNVIECFFKKDIYKDDAGYDPWRPLPKGWLESDAFKTRMLRLIEWGARPAIYDLTAATVPELAAMHRFYAPYKRLQLEFLEEHRQIADGVFLAKYGDGTRVVVNYTDKPFILEGKAVEPKNYMIFEPSAMPKKKPARRAGMYPPRPLFKGAAK